ncbi:hypothetical protein EDC04DRAFT_2841352 [Pisolithus marmoratus]|nr:hypothetical protein EDC04DRAFT_2841352 [Pisolithus marmoratus]
MASLTTTRPYTLAMHSLLRLPVATSLFLACIPGMVTLTMVCGFTSLLKSELCQHNKLLLELELHWVWSSLPWIFNRQLICGLSDNPNHDGHSLVTARVRMSTTNSDPEAKGGGR